MAATLVGAFLVSSAVGSIDIYCDSPSFPCAYKTDKPRLAGGVLLMTVGGLAAVAGVPMWVIGSQWIYKPQADQKKPALLPELRVGLGSAAISVRF